MLLPGLPTNYGASLLTSRSSKPTRSSSTTDCIPLATLTTPLPDVSAKSECDVTVSPTKVAHLLEARVSETQMVETIKLATITDIRWRLLPHGIIERSLIYQPVLQLQPHDLNYMRAAALLPKSTKLRLVATEVDGSAGVKRNVAWIARFASRQDAKTWLTMIKMLTNGRLLNTSQKSNSKPAEKAQLQPPNDPFHQTAAGDYALPETLAPSTNLGSITTSRAVTPALSVSPPPKPPRMHLKPGSSTLSRSKFSNYSIESAIYRKRPPDSRTLLSMPSSVTTALPPNAPNRRHVILRGPMEKHLPRKHRGFRFRVWCPVTWVFYSDGSLEEYAKSKSSHDLLNLMYLDDFEVRVPMSKVQERMGGPSFTVPPDCYLNLSRLASGRKIRYRAPNKLMQIQWLGTLTEPRRSNNAARKRTTGMAHSRMMLMQEKCRLPRKLSIMQEKCLVDIFGLIVPLWINVVWEYSAQYGIRRRYEDVSRHVVKQVTVVEDLYLQAEDVLSIPDSKKAKRQIISIYGWTGNWLVPQKSGRRFTITRPHNPEEDKICVRAESVQLRDEWYEILRSIRNDLTPPLPVEGWPLLSKACIPEFDELVVNEIVRGTKSAIEVSTVQRSPDVPEFYSMSAADDLLAPDTGTTVNSVSFSLSQGDDDRLFYHSIPSERTKHFAVKYRNDGDTAKRKTAVLEGNDGTFEVLPRLTEDMDL